MGEWNYGRNGRNGTNGMEKTEGTERGIAGLHLFGGGDAEEGEALLEDAGGEVAEGQAGGAGGAFGLEDRTVFVEAGKFAGEIVEVGAEEIGTVFVGHGFQDEAEIEEAAGEDDFFGGFQNQGGRGGGGVRGGFAGFAEDAANTSVGVEEVGGGVALEGEHFVPTEDVVALAVLGEVGVFDGAEADAAGDLAAGFFGPFGIL